MGPHFNSYSKSGIPYIKGQTHSFYDSRIMEADNTIDFQTLQLLHLLPHRGYNWMTSVQGWNWGETIYIGWPEPSRTERDEALIIWLHRDYTTCPKSHFNMKGANSA